MIITALLCFGFVCSVSAAAQEVLVRFYLSLRASHHEADGTPITTRHIESLIRMAEARAKIELRQVVTEQDANVRVQFGLWMSFFSSHWVSLIIGCSQPNTYRM